VRVFQAMENPEVVLYLITGNPILLTEARRMIFTKNITIRERAILVVRRIKYVAGK
jgi:hypothetical protein